MSAHSITEDDANWLLEHADRILADWSWPTDLLALTSCLRKSFSPIQARLLSELLELRYRARAKYSRAEKMYFHRRGLEQATDEPIARYKASRFAADATSIIDLCCGIGGDAIGFAQEFDRVMVVDRDPATARFATANARQYGAKTIGGQVGDVRDADLSDYPYWHIDPDRRASEQRRSRPALCEPPLDDFLALPGRSEHGAIKLSPAADASQLSTLGVELEWIGNRRECQQQVAWFGRLARHPGRRSATWIDDVGIVTTITERSGRQIDVVDQMPKYVYEPKSSVLAAHLDNTLAQAEELLQLTAQAAYYAADHLSESRLLTAFEVMDDMAYHRKSLASRLAALDASVAEVKKRRVSVEPHEVLREYRKYKGNHSVTLLFYPRGDTVRVVIAKRVKV